MSPGQLSPSIPVLFRPTEYRPYAGMVTIDCDAVSDHAAVSVSGIGSGAALLDYDGDGKSDLGVYFPPGGNWYIFGSQRGFFTDQFGYAGTRPLGGPPVVP